MNANDDEVTGDQAAEEKTARSSCARNRSVFVGGPRPE